MIAALYVETGGCYFGLAGVDPWDKARDARTYAGPWPVVAHPPCERWSIMGLCRGYGDGKDDGCFEAALSAVQKFGGVIEHPAHSLAWKAFGLPQPSAGGGWIGSILRKGWSCEVDQRWYGHEARKPTWLYFVGPPPRALKWGSADAGEKTIGRSYGGGRQHLRARTPTAFRDLLLSIARTAQTESQAA